MKDTVLPRLILASASPRRRDLLAVLGLPFEIRVAGIPEQRLAGETPEDYVRRVAREKAEAVAASLAPDEGPCLVIAADTEVALEADVLGKPATPAEARAMLLRLRARVHTVLSAVVVLDPADGRRAETLCRSAVPLRDYSDAELDAYIASGDPFDKAGGYAIQHTGFHPVERFNHCYASVMGLPLCHLLLTLRQMGVHPSSNAPSACQAVNDYACPVYAGILEGGAVITVTKPAHPIPT